MKIPPPDKEKKRLKRRANLLYRLRLYGVKVDTRQRIIYRHYEHNPDTFTQVRKLREEFDFHIQIGFI